MAKTSCPKPVVPDRGAWQRCAARIEAASRVDPLEAGNDVRALRDDIGAFVAANADAPADVIRRARDVVSLLDGLSAAVANDRVQSISGLELQVRRLEDALPPRSPSPVSKP